MKDTTLLQCSVQHSRQPDASLLQLLRRYDGFLPRILKRQNNRRVRPALPGDVAVAIWRVSLAHCSGLPADQPRFSVGAISRSRRAATWTGCSGKCLIWREYWRSGRATRNDGRRGRDKSAFQDVAQDPTRIIPSFTRPHKSALKTRCIHKL